MFSYFFLPKVVQCKRECGNIWHSQTGHRRQYNTGSEDAIACRLTKAATLTLIIISSLLEIFALLGCYAAKIGSHRRFGTTYRSP